MSGFTTTQLEACIERNQACIPELAEISRQLQGSTDPITLYGQCYPLLEQAMWSGTADFHALLADYQALFREQEALISQRGIDDRHDFLIGIPIAGEEAIVLAFSNF